MVGLGWTVGQDWTGFDCVGRCLTGFDGVGLSWTESQLRRILPCINLRHSKFLLTTYSGEKMPVVGKVSVQVQTLNYQKLQLHVYCTAAISSAATGRTAWCVSWRGTRLFSLLLFCLCFSSPCVT